jgi:hypothetical protein
MTNKPITCIAQAVCDCYLAEKHLVVEFKQPGSLKLLISQQAAARYLHLRPPTKWAELATLWLVLVELVSSRLHCLPRGEAIPGSSSPGESSSVSAASLI